MVNLPRILRGVGLAVAVALMAASSAWGAASLSAGATVVAGSDPLEQTAAGDLQTFLHDQLNAASPEGSAAVRIVVGTVTDQPDIAAAQAKQPFVLDDKSEESYALSYRAGTLYIVGQGPKGAMNGVYRLMQRGAAALKALDVSTLQEQGTPVFRYRIGDHLRTQKMPPDYSDEQQGRWYAQHFINVVWGEKFGPPLPQAVRRKFGLKLMLEASLPPTPEGTHWGESGHASAWFDDPANASCVYNWGRPSWYGKPLVVDPFDPVGRQAYLNHFNRLLEKNPDTRILYCIFGDYSWAPNEQSTRVSDGKKYAHTQEETIRQIMALMKQSIGDREVIPAVWMWLLFPKQGKEAFMEQMSADGYGVMYNEASDNDCWTYLRNNFDSVCLKLGADGKTRFGPKYIPLVSVGGTCESVRPGVAMPLPFVGGWKTEQVYKAGVQNLLIWWGSCEGWAYHANMEVLAEMIWNPGAFDAANKDPFNPEHPEPLIGSIARRDFGELAPQVLKFWGAFDAALVDTDLKGNKTGLQNQSWYQRTGNYLIFLSAEDMPLVPKVLRDKSKVASLFPWILRPKAKENWAMVHRNLGRAIEQLGALRNRPDVPKEVAWRLRMMHLNTQAFYRIFSNEFHHMRALQVMEPMRDLADDSPRLKAALAPIVREDLANTEALIKLLEQFPSNFYLSGKQEKENQPTRDAEIAKLRQKLAAARAYLGAESASAVDLAGGAERGDSVDLGAVRAIEVVAVRWKQPPVGEWSLAVSADGQAWQPVSQDNVAHDDPAVETVGFAMRRARFVRVQPSAAAACVDRLHVYGPAALTGLTARGGLLRPAFSPAIRHYDLEMAWNQHSIELTPVLGSAKQVRINDVMSGGEAVRVEPGAEPITVEVAEEGGETVRYTLTPRRNLAAGATATADSFDTKFPPAMAVDGDGTYGDDASRWVSLANAGGHWLALDLGQERRIGRAVVATGHQRAANLPIQAMTLQASADGQAWRDIAGAAVTQNDRNVVELKFAPLTTRHVRLVVGQSPDDRARVYELALYEQ